MELARVEIRLSGSLANTVVRHKVTPPELLLLRELHGDEAIANIEYTGKEAKAHHEVLDAMNTFYNTENGKRAMEKIFPGASPKIPTTFREIGYDISEEGELRQREQLQKKYQDELTRKVKEAAIKRGVDPDTIKTVEYDDNKPAA